MLLGPLFLYCGQITSIGALTVTCNLLGATAATLGLLAVGLGVRRSRSPRKQLPLAATLILVALGALILALQGDAMLFLTVLVGAGLAVVQAWYQKVLQPQSRSK